MGGLPYPSSKDLPPQTLLDKAVLQHCILHPLQLAWFKRPASLQSEPSHRDAPSSVLPRSLSTIQKGIYKFPVARLSFKEDLKVQPIRCWNPARQERPRAPHASQMKAELLLVLNLLG